MNSRNLFAANIYVDKTVTNCSGNYSVSNRTCTGSDGYSYDTIQEAINACSVGDTIYMRGGAYYEISIDIPESKNGTAWTSGNHTILMSYPGEWAIVDGTGLNASSTWYSQAVFTHPTGYGTGETAQYTRYWKFSNFEVTGGRTGFFLKADHLWWQYMYIHDNGRDRGATDTLIGGILSVCPHNSIIEYSYFKDNIQTSGADMNNSNILFDSDYKDNSDNSGEGEALDLNAATHSNIVRYNYLIGSMISLRQKNQQRFGYNGRNPGTMTYQDYGDKWHHNIILDARESIGASQDFIQVFNNITDTTINFGRMSGSSGDVPQMYNGVIYNNTVNRDATDAIYGSFATSGGRSTTMNNYYDNGAQQTVHEHVWFLNNIASGNPNVYQDVPFLLHWNIPKNTSNPDQDNSDLVIDRNLIHDNSNSYDFIIGHNYDAGYAGCDKQYVSSASIDTCTETWRSISGVTNWDEMGTLFLGASGANQYITNESFSVGITTVADGGNGGNHPYLSGVTIPSYIGATNPDDHAWVAGVLGLNVLYLARANGDPSWVEGSDRPATSPMLRVEPQN